MKLKCLYLILFMLCVSTVIFAQEKYEQAIMMQCGLSINISIEGKEFKKIKLTREDVTGDNYNFSPLLKQVAAMREEGWEVWSFSNYTDFTGLVYALRRKIKQ